MQLHALLFVCSLAIPLSLLLQGCDERSDLRRLSSPQMAFVKKKANSTWLTLDGQQFRFASVNVEYLTMVQDPLVTEDPYDWQFEFRPPTFFEVEAAFQAVKQLGGTVIRMYPFSIQNPRIPRVKTAATSYFRLRNPQNATSGLEFNPELRGTFDHVLAMGAKYQIRLIVPLINEFEYWGGVESFCLAYGHDCSGSKRVDFFADPTLRQEFLRLVRELASDYGDNAAILGWETGNELGKAQGLDETPEFDDWTRALAAELKSIAPSGPLVVDGAMFARFKYYGGDDDVDVLDIHYYPGEGDGWKLREWLKQDLVAARAASKALVIGEFLCNLESCMRPFVTGPGGWVDSVDASGLLLWALSIHMDGAAMAQHPAGGFFYHHEPYDNGALWDFHWPGFPQNDFYNETQTLVMMQYAAARANGNASATRSQPYPSPLAAPPPPVLTLIAPGQGEWLCYWNGSPGAEKYEAWVSDGKLSAWQKLNGTFYDIAPTGNRGWPYGYMPMHVPSSQYPRLCVKMVAKNREHSSGVSEVLCSKG